MSGVVSPWAGDKPCECIKCARWAFFGLVVTHNLDRYLTDRQPKQPRHKPNAAARRSAAEAWVALVDDLDAASVAGGMGPFVPPAARPCPAALWLSLTLVLVSTLTSTHRDPPPGRPVPAAPPDYVPREAELRARTLIAAPGAPYGSPAAAA